MDDAAPAAPPEEPAVVIVRRRRWPRALAGLLMMLLAIFGIAWAILNSPIGNRFVADRIARYAPASGLKVDVGRIEGRILGTSKLYDVTLSDPQGPFLRVPQIDLDWRPLAWFTTGLDIRTLALHRGTLLRAPRLVPGDPNAPILPDFDIRIDRFSVDNLTVAKGIAGPARRVDLLAKADVRRGKVYLLTRGQLGGTDKLFALIDSEPGKRRFDLKLDYRAPKGGLLAALAGAKEELNIRVGGKGDYRLWTGGLLVDQTSGNLAALQLVQRSGRYNVAGLVHPDGFLAGIAKRAAGDTVALTGQGTLLKSVLEGDATVIGQGATFTAKGAVDLANNAFRQVATTTTLKDSRLLGEAIQLDGTLVNATLDGPFRNLTIAHRATVARLTSGTTRLDGLVQQGTATFDGRAWVLPLDVAITRVVTGNASVDPRLVGARLTGMVGLADGKVASDRLAFYSPGVKALLALRGDIVTGGYGLAGPVQVRGFAVPNLGLADADAAIRLSFGATPWKLDTQVTGRLARVDNPTLTTIAGTGIRFAGHLVMGAGQPILFDRASLNGSKLSLGVAGRRLADGRTTLSGSGRHTDYGRFTVNATVAGDGPRAELVFADPFPAAGLKDVRVALAPIPQGFRIETRGGSTLGPFNGVLGLFATPGGPTRIAVERFEVWKTNVTGALTLGGSAVSGDLALAGGGIDGTVKLMPREGGQGFDVALTAREARFGGATPLAIGNGQLEATGLLKDGHSTVQGSLTAQGIQQGSLFIGRMAASARLVDGSGRVTASIAGRRGSRFAVQGLADLTPGRVAALLTGDYAGQKIEMPRRAELTRDGDGWRLAPTQLNVAGGKVIGEGRFGGGATDLHLALSDMPLSLIDIFTTELGLGGKASGLVDIRTASGGAPTGSARLAVKGLSRSGLILTSRPIDLMLVADLGATTLQTRAVLRDGGQTRGRVQARIGLGQGANLAERVTAGSLQAQLRYSGAADSLWRLLALDTFDLTGPLEVAADVTGSVRDPSIRGTLASSALRLQSALTGTDLKNIVARGNFDGSRLTIGQFTGQTNGGGTVSGSGFVDLSGLGQKGPGIDLKLAATNAELLARDDMAATVTGPLRIVSDGVNGTIAGRLHVVKARWALGRATAAADLPSIATREINLPYDMAPARVALKPWRYLIDAVAENRVEVRGMGLDSEWGANVRIRGTTAAPAIAGQADFIRGGYEFAGKRFELTRGRIYFDGGSPSNPRIDIAATATVDSLTASVTVSGTALRPEIAFSSVPSLPEEELLSRLLFGNSITQISAPEALQLGAALASLRGGGGMDPINKLRTAIGLDRLRIVGADAATGRGTSVAVGKYIGRRFYAEIITDGRGYSATQLEFRVTSFLSILSSLSTVGRQSLNVKVSKDY